jgi:hypothetical protein
MVRQNPPEQNGSIAPSQWQPVPRRHGLHDATPAGIIERE